MSIGTQQAIGRIVVLLSAILWPWLGEEAEADPVRIAYADVFPPFTELKGGEAQGLAVEIVRAAARRAGIEIDFVPVPFVPRGNQGEKRATIRMRMAPGVG
jgi:ABC-type amino acid transport substrate-binding protein